MRRAGDPYGGCAVWSSLGDTYFLRDPRAKVAHSNGVMVFGLAGGQIYAMTRFDISVLPRFGLPLTLPDLAGAGLSRSRT